MRFELEKIRDLIAHSHPGASYSEVIAYLTKLGLKKLDPTQAKGRASKNTPPGEQISTSSKKHMPVLTQSAIPESVKREVWKRDGSKCTYAAPNGRPCDATAFVQMDHIIPRAKNGSNELSNLRLRCRKHNLLAAVQEFGEAKMKNWVS